MKLVDIVNVGVVVANGCLYDIGGHASQSTDIKAVRLLRKVG